MDDAKAETLIQLDSVQMISWTCGQLGMLVGPLGLLQTIQGIQGQVAENAKRDGH